MKNRYILLSDSRKFPTIVSCFMLLICMVPQALSANTKELLKIDSVQQQTVAELMQALKPGDRMPESFWDMPMELDNFRGEKLQYTYGAMKGRVIIFDFWATTCKSCIENIPHMEQIQEKYPDELAIILVNSKRNRDTPRRINATMKRYKETYKYDIALFTLLDDTLLTTLFSHNTIPSTAWISPDGIYMGNTLPDEVNTKNIDTVIKTGKVDLELIPLFRNAGDRYNVPPLQDTVGAEFISEITPYNLYYLPTYPNVFHKDGHSSYQTINSSFSFMLGQSYKKELIGLAWTDYVFDEHIAQDVKDKLFYGSENRNIFSYQLYVRDSINQNQAEGYFRKAFSEYFKLNVSRKKGKIAVYQVSFNDKFEQIKTKGEIPINQPYPKDGVVQYRNVPVSGVLGSLFYYFDKPLVFDRADMRKIDIVFPQDFVKQSLAERISFLESQGIKLTPVRTVRDYVSIAPLK
ncbi:TlpA disulfide reductase family protein [Sphingobacterium faecium]|uniref:TlpA family protein disulfide reductase n=1 Tax=Sphingobacterium faecium TaxID=34087 RepID=UPI00320A1A72